MGVRKIEALRVGPSAGDVSPQEVIPQCVLFIPALRNDLLAEKRAICKPTDKPVQNPGPGVSLSQTGHSGNQNVLGGNVHQWCLPGTT